MMDTPVGYSWQELVQLASNRDSWRARVQRLKQPSRVEVTINPDAPGAKAKPPQQNKIPQHAETKSTTTCNNYPDRDAHEMFFRPKSKSTSTRTHKYNTRPKAKSKAKPRPLTDKQRAQWAREHYEQHHGTTATTTTHTTPTKNSSQLQIPVSPQTPNLQSPIILGHCNDSINNNINWSPTILGHHRHSHTQHSTNANDTLLPPIHIMDMFEYLDHISSNHENIKNLSNSSF